MLRICWNWLVHDAAPSGANRRRVELLKRMAGAEYAHVIDKIIVVTRSGRAIPELPASTIHEVIRMPGGAAGRFVYETRALKKVVARHSCNILFQEAFPVPRIVNIPIVLTIHDLRDLSPEARPAGVPGRLAAATVICSGVASATKVVAVSNFTKNEIVTYAGAARGKVVVIPNAADHTKSPSTKPPRSQNTILCVGHLEARKRPDLLLEAFVLVQKEIPGATLQFCGRGPLEKKLRERALQLKLNGSVSFRSNCSDRELIQLYQTAAVVAFPSKYEGFGIPLLEAMRLGTPVIASKNSAIPEIAGDAAILIDSNDPKTWAAAIANILMNTNVASDYSIRGAAQEKKYSWTASALALVKLAEAMTTKTETEL